MPVYREEPETQVVESRSGGMTGYALVKYGFIFLITLVILYFIANYLLGG